MSEHAQLLHTFTNTSVSHSFDFFFSDLMAISSVVNSIVNCVFIPLCPLYDDVFCLFLTDL